MNLVAALAIAPPNRRTPPGSLTIVYWLMTCTVAVASVYCSSRGKLPTLFGPAATSPDLSCRYRVSPSVTLGIAAAPVDPPEATSGPQGAPEWISTSLLTAVLQVTFAVAV